VDTSSGSWQYPGGFGSSAFAQSLVVRQWRPASDLQIKSLNTSSALLAKGEIANISLLGSDAKLSWQNNSEELRVTLPHEKPGDFAYVFKISLN
jgi:alpha-L-fucosidase